MNFTYTLRPPPDGEWGVIREDGTWTGQVGELAAGRVDIGKKKLSFIDLLIIN